MLPLHKGSSFASRDIFSNWYHLIKQLILLPIWQVSPGRPPGGVPVQEHHQCRDQLLPGERADHLDPVWNPGGILQWSRAGSLQQARDRVHTAGRWANPTFIILHHPTASSGRLLPAVPPWNLRNQWSLQSKWIDSLEQEALQISNAWAELRPCSISVVGKAGSEVRNYLFGWPLVMTCCHTLRSESAAAEVINRSADESWGPGEWIYGTCDRQGLRLPCLES